jgi:hypothetical protein
MTMRYCLIPLVAGSLWAQQVVAPTPETVGSGRGENVGEYNITNSFETGYRWSLIDGDLGKYRADVNYRNGIRLLGSSLSVDSRDGHGHLFDQILLNTIGLGNDPYQSATLRVQKNGLYRYDMVWRLNEYYNPGLTISEGLHQLDTRRRLQDHDLTLLPQSKFKFRLGYSRNTQTGPGLSSAQEGDFRSAPIPLFTDIRREWNEYRVGAEGEVAGFKLTVLHRWEFYKDDSPYVNADGTIRRSEPYHGKSPSWLGDLFTERKYWGLNARMTYSSGQRNFALNEAGPGVVTGGTTFQQIVVSGNAQRPVTAGDFNLRFYPTDRLIITNNSSVHSTRIEGYSNFAEYSTVLAFLNDVNFRYLGIRTVANATDIHYRLTPWIGVYGGYHYSDRLITTVEGVNTGTPEFDNFDYSRSGHLHAGVLGVQIHPLQPLTIRLDGEVGRDNHPLTPISDRDYHTLNGRVDYRVRKFQLSATYKQVYNVNSVDFSNYSSRSRDYTANASWAPKDRFSLDASYMKLHVDTISGLAFFAGVGRPTAQVFPYLYLSNVHAANLGAHFGVMKRADLYVGYSITKDVGDGRNTAVPAGVTDPVQALFDSVQTFPLTFQSPLARLSIKITPKIRWNAGWQFYRYHDEFGLLTFYQAYRANTGYTSLLWSF